ncbi:hypothetical protein ACM7M5_13665 [Pseudomonas aeruginosa]|uniref:hypothetical protein n=1 Tax=Pseudomonas aeruginosa TaxID=287 RepID=UPI002A69AB80|nr:hypothetical protein [Pseudomonas aeruginosa]MDY1296063.1 hypothetical protein [Pseudomonas aeruginosa]HEP7957082.1 hypothetical protein [Pseudomonas aeruginosa]
MLDSLVQGEIKLSEYLPLIDIESTFLIFNAGRRLPQQRRHRQWNIPTISSSCHVPVSTQDSGRRPNAFNVDVSIRLLIANPLSRRSARAAGRLRVRGTG